MRFLLLAGCLSSVIPDPKAPEGGGLDAVLSGGEFRGAGFSRVNRAPFPSAVHGDVNVYVSTAAADGYRSIAPESLAPAPPIPLGALFVREILDDSGITAQLTVMEKREPGFFPGGGDFLYGATAPDGTTLLADDGTVEWGALNDCGSCHAQRSGQGWLYGVTEAAR